MDVGPLAYANMLMYLSKKKLTWINKKRLTIDCTYETICSR
jgi:hypothetical protein